MFSNQYPNYRHDDVYAGLHIQPTFDLDLEAGLYCPLFSLLMKCIYLFTRLFKFAQREDIWLTLI